MTMVTPRVTILIPHFNNGRASSRSGQLDLIGDLLQSLWDTLHDDPTPFELFVHDDASTDDSIDTLRAWADRTWPNGEPFLTLVESPHEGFIAAANNRMFRRARGDILVRLDGDIVCTTNHWISRVVEMFDDAPPRLGILGPMQLSPSGQVHACGDMILHPRGYHHLDHGRSPDEITTPREVDHHMGCFYCCKRAVFDDIGGYDENCLRGETEDFTMMARLVGWSCWTLPHVRFIHRHSLRKARASQYDDGGRIADDLAYFRKKWGFCRLAPDLDAALDRWRGTPLLWNAQVFGPVIAARGSAGVEAAGVNPPAPSARPFEATDWARFAHDPAVRPRVDLPVTAVRQLLGLSATATHQKPRVALVGPGDGVAAHLLAKAGIPCVGILLGRDAPHRARLASRCVRGGDYPNAAPTYSTMPDSRTLPLDAACVDLLLLHAALAAHPNPVALLREAERVLAPGGMLAVLESPIRYAPQQLVNQVHFLGGWHSAIQPAKAGDHTLMAWRPAAPRMARAA